MMKKVLFFPAFLIAVGAIAQTPVKKSIPIVQKATATWCGPCGQWGWDLMDDIRDDNKAKAFVFSLYGDNGSNYYNQAAGDLTSWGQSWPNWGVNNINRTAFQGSGINPTGTQTTIKSAVDSFYGTVPVASTGFTYTIAGNKITVKTKSKFWKATSGEYYVAAYIVEDSVYGMQNGKPSDVYHHDVLRGSMTAGSTYGVPLASGTINLNQEASKDFTFNIVDPSWVKNRIKIVTMIWKKNGSTYDFVNANHIKSSTTSVANIEAVEDLDVYPNPASQVINISGSLTKASAQISLVNAVGQVVYSKDVNNGQLAERIQIDNLSNGVYLLNITSEGALSSRKIVVAK
jgi:hypothetical protein